METIKKPYKVIRVVNDKAVIIDSFESAIESYKKRELLNVMYGEGYCECYISVEAHKVGLAECDICAHQWEAVIPEWVKFLECPNCGNIATL